MLRLLLVLLGALRSAFRSRANLALENLALRQQLACFLSSPTRRPPHITSADRWFWLTLRRIWSRWFEVLVFVKPETVVRWHRAGFRRFWTWRSRRRKPGRPPIDRGIRDLIQRMATENPTWGAPRIHGELRMVGFDVSERTVSRYLPRRPRGPDAVRRWLVFLRNHRDGLAAMDLFTVPTVTFRVLYIWFVIEHARRRILGFAITDHPSAIWVAQELREAFPFDSAACYLIVDRDSTFATSVTATSRASGWSRYARRVAAHGRSAWRKGGSVASAASCSTNKHVVVLGRGPPMAGLHHRYEWNAAA
jgi:putative transposase